MSFLTPEMYHRAGMMLENHCSTTGVLSMGNMNPDKTMTGIIKPKPETNIASTCLFTNVDISNPNDKATVMKTKEKTLSQIRLPLMGT
jgi:hypothetical protein